MFFIFELYCTKVVTKILFLFQQMCFIIYIDFLLKILKLLLFDKSIVVVNPVLRKNCKNHIYWVSQPLRQVIECLEDKIYLLIMCFCLMIGLNIFFLYILKTFLNYTGAFKLGATKIPLFKCIL